MTKNKKRIISFFLAGMILFTWLAMCIRTNIENPKIPLERYYIGDAFTLKNREVVLLNYEIIDGVETKKLLKETDAVWYKEIINEYNDNRIRMVLFTVTIQNIGDTLIEYAPGILGGMMITNVDSLSYPYTDVTDMINKKTLGENWSKLEVGEKKQYTIAYFLDSSWMSPRWWESVDNLSYELILDDYPVEIHVCAMEEKR